MGKHIKRLVVVTEFKKEVRLNGVKYHYEYLNFINEELKKMIANHANVVKAKGGKLIDPKLLYTVKFETKSEYISPVDGVKSDTTTSEVTP